MILYQLHWKQFRNLGGFEIQIVIRSDTDIMPSLMISCNLSKKKGESEVDKQTSKSNVAREIRNKLDRFAKKNAEEKGYGGQGSSNSGAKKGKGKKKKICGC